MAKKSASKVQTPVRSNDIRSFFTKTPTSASKPKIEKKEEIVEAESNQNKDIAEEVADIKLVIKKDPEDKVADENVPPPPSKSVEEDKEKKPEDGEENAEEEKKPEEKQIRTRKTYIDADICLIEEADTDEESGTIYLDNSDNDGEDGTISGMSSEFDEDEFPFEDSSFDGGDSFDESDLEKDDDNDEEEGSKAPKKKSKKIQSDNDDDDDNVDDEDLEIPSDNEEEENENKENDKDAEMPEEGENVKSD
uniref:Uncharacterized protein n=1 Tax=Panagrolaimus sp. ES5 TaxID=591445 RepID=A0AC34F4I9_9BILA